MLPAVQGALLAVGRRPAPHKAGAANKEHVVNFRRPVPRLSSSVLGFLSKVKSVAAVRLNAAATLNLDADHLIATHRQDVYASVNGWHGSVESCA